MDYMNHTSPLQFILIGLSTNNYLQSVYFILFLIMYIATVVGNALIIIVVRVDSRLHTPMYFFLSNLSFIDLCFSSTIVPKLLVITLTKDKSISFLGCATQMYFHLGLGGTECVILSIMAFDRYVAICNPLRYSTIMTKQICAQLAVGTWCANFLNSISYAFFTFQLPYCRSNHVDHYFCEMPPLFRLSCKDTLMNEIAVYVSGGLVAICAFALTLMSYGQIISTVLKIQSTEGRHKAFSTCASHLAVVCLYYGAISFMYMRPRNSYSPNKDRAVSILYTVVTPMVNPIIYSIRNKEVKGSLKRMILTKIKS
ncbi:olfactory receptor-like protein OLF3 [Rana temporaria]|uniref:olfactory receptor-like protein OLF3 n=1 Tax=Rana temporaria TaxID=8407 RepID=UPI001AAD02FF|nr:olfactory receptor-like protein OLF3 [Rana temporaria]